MIIKIDGIDYGFMFQCPKDLVPPTNSGFLLLKGAGTKISLPLAAYYWVDLLRKKVFWNMYAPEIPNGLKWEEVSNEHDMNLLIEILPSIQINLDTEHLSINIKLR